MSAGDDAVASLEADLLLRNITLSHLRELAVRPRSAALFHSKHLCTDTGVHGLLQTQQGSVGASAIDVRLAAEEAEADRSLLRLFQAALKAEKLGRALDLATCLALPLSLEGALRLARHHKCAACPARALLPGRSPACSRIWGCMPPCKDLTRRCCSCRAPALVERLQSLQLQSQPLADENSPSEVLTWCCI